MAVQCASTNSLPSTQIPSAALNSSNIFAMTQLVEIRVDDELSASPSNHSNSSMNFTEVVSRFVASVDRDVGVLPSSSTGILNMTSSINSRNFQSCMYGDNKENVDPCRIHGVPSTGYSTGRHCGAKRVPLQDITSMFQPVGRCINDNTRLVSAGKPSHIQSGTYKPQVLKSGVNSTIPNTGVSANTNGRALSKMKPMR